MPSETTTFIPFFYMYKKRPKKRRYKFPFFRPQFYVYTSAYLKELKDGQYTYDRCLACLVQNYAVSFYGVSVNTNDLLTGNKGTERLAIYIWPFFSTEWHRV